MRKTLIIAAIALVVVIAGVWGGSVIYASLQNEQASAELTLAPPSAGAPSTLSEDGLAGTWTIGQESEAGYRVNEVLNGQPVTVVGRTSDIKGEATIEGTRLTAATAEVDMRNVATDNGSRDGQFQGILKTGQFPSATFTLTEAVDIGAISGGSASTEAAGELTLAGVTQAVTVNLKAQVTSDGVDVQGSIPITFSDFEISAPNLGFVKVEDAGTVEMLLHLKK